MIKKDRVILFLLLLLPLTVIDTTINQVYLFAIMPIAFLYCFSVSPGTFKQRYIIIFFIILIWHCICAMVLSNYERDTIIVIRQIIGTYIYGYVFFTIATRNESNLKWLYLIIFSYYFINWITAIVYANLLQIDVTSDRLQGATDVDEINANRFGYFTLFFTFVLFIYGTLSKNQRGKKAFRFLFLSYIFVILLTAIVTGSRQILILNIPLYLILLFLRYKNSFFNPIVIVNTTVLATLLFIFLAPELLQIYDGSVLQKRTESTTIKEDQRTYLFYKGIDTGTENIIFGIGPGMFLVKYSMVTHCSYSEIFAETGIIGLLLFLILLFDCFYVQLKRYFKTKDEVFLYFAIFVFFYILDNLFFIFYESFLLMSMFFITAVHSDLYFKKYNSTSRQGLYHLR